LQVNPIRQFKFGICNLQVDGKKQNRFLQAAKQVLE